jgi:hypothetical protein
MLIPPSSCGRLVDDGHDVYGAAALEVVLGERVVARQDAARKEQPLLRRLHTRHLAEWPTPRSLSMV